MPTIKAMLTQAGLLGTQSSTSVKPKGKQVANGIYVNQEGLTPEEELELFNIIKPVLEAQAVRSNKGIFSPKMAGLGLNWDYLNGQTKRRDKGFEKVNIKDPLQKNSTYGWFTSSSTGKRLAPISDRLIELMTKATGIDVSDYDGSIINIYNENSFIGNHPDIDESKTAEKYPVVVVNIGGPGNIMLGTNTNNVKVDLRSGAGYIFGHQGKNRTVPHSTYAAPIKGTLPAITTKMDGETIPANSYRISITMRRVMPLEAGMPSEPAVVSEVVSNVKPSTKILSVPVVNATAKKNIDAFIEQAKLLKAEGKNLAFPKSGLGQEMRKTIKGKTSPSHQTFLYLSERLLELGYLNPGFVKSLSDPQDQTSKTGYKIVQEFQEVSDNEASDNLLNC
jgi:alkylated DNA repair dioxygenase AlkB